MTPLFTTLRSIHTESTRKFIDRVKLQVVGGRGGKGVMAYEHPAPWKKRPVGGNGGRGGDIVLEACASVQDLHFSSYVVRGRPGGDATRNGAMGRGGKAKRLMVPVGTLVKELKRVFTLESVEGDWGEEVGGEGEGEIEGGGGGGALNSAGGGGGGGGGGARAAAAVMGAYPLVAYPVEGQEPLDKLRRVRGGGLGLGATEGDTPPPSLQRTTRAGLSYREDAVLLADLSTPGSKVLVARGGEPGYGNKGSLLTFSEQMSDTLKPHIGGGRGENRMLELELKSIADAGLVGFPNAGKSSLLAAVSKARPRVADYPFTTLHPHVGALAYADGFSATMADIPGLVEGAHGDAGMGHQFLRHVERTRVLLYVVDAAGKDPVGDLKALQLELRLYKAELPARPSLVVANKMDLVVVGVQQQHLEALKAATPMPVFPVSTITKEGLPALLQAIRWFCERGEAAGGGAKK